MQVTWWIPSSFMVRSSAFRVSHTGYPQRTPSTFPCHPNGYGRFSDGHSVQGAARAKSKEGAETPTLSAVARFEVPRSFGAGAYADWHGRQYPNRSNARDLVPTADLRALASQ